MINYDANTFFNNTFIKNTRISEYFIQFIFTNIVKCGDCVIDVGANRGFHTLPLCKLVGKEGKVIACEAIKDSIEDIKKYTQYNENIFLLIQL